MDEILDQEPVEPEYKPERPLLITILCVLMGLGALVAIPTLFTRDLDILGLWYRPYLALSCFVGLASMVGLWLMKKWALYVYTAFAILNQVIMFSMGFWSFYSLVIVAIFVILLSTQYHKMR